MFTTSTNMSILAVTLRKLLTGYIGKQTLGKDDTYLHFLHSMYRMAKRPTVIKKLVITVFKNNICCSCSTNVSSQFRGNVGGLYVNPLPFLNGGSVNALTPPVFPFGVTNLYSSITAKLRIILSSIRAQKIQMIIKHIIAARPKSAEINSKIRHFSTFFMNIVNSF